MLFFNRALVSSRNLWVSVQNRESGALTSSPECLHDLGLIPQPSLGLRLGVCALIEVLMLGPNRASDILRF